MAKKSEYHIGFTGLSDGIHEFSFHLGKTFFEQLDYTEIADADLQVKLVLEKKPNMLLATFSLEGTVNIMCDRCTDYFDLPISGQSELIYKFSEQDLDDEHVMTIYPNETEINVAQPIYEFVILLLPARRVHPDGKCNQEMLNDIDQYLMIQAENNNSEDEIKSEDDEVDPRWAALQKLKNNKN